MAAARNINAWVVDDDDSVRWVLEKALEKAGVSVRSFPAASPALDAFSNDQPDVVITDIQMPGMNGLEFARGLVNYTAEEVMKLKGRHSRDIEKVLGYKYYDEIIHRDDLVVFEAT